MKRSDKNTTPVEDSDIRVDGTPMPGVAARIAHFPIVERYRPSRFH